MSPPAEPPADPPIAAKPAVNSAARTSNRSEPSEGGRAGLQRPFAPEPSVLRHMAAIEERPAVTRTGSGANRNANSASVTKVGLQVISLIKVQKLCEF